MPYFLSPIGNTQLIDANGAPLNGGKLETYLAGTSTPRTTYTTQAGNVPQGAVMTLNSLGYPANGAVWMEGGIALKFVVKNAADVVQSTFDNISGIGDTNAAPDEWVVFRDAVPAYVSATVFAVANDQTNIFQVNRKLKSANTGGTVYSQIVSSVFSVDKTTVTVINSVGVLDAGLSAVSYGLFAPNNSSIPESTIGAAIRVAATQAAAKSALGVVDPVPVRQTVLSGPVDSNGFSAFGGATGSTTVTATATIKATAAGGDANYTGSITNPSWTGLSTNDTMCLFLDITSAGVVTTGSTTLAPNYRWGGADVITNLQNTFNIQEMTMKVGNGTTASQVFRVFVGEVTVAGGVVTAIVWYALQGRYIGAYVATLPAHSTAVSVNHNLGVIPGSQRVRLKCNNVSANYAVNDTVLNPMARDGGGAYFALFGQGASRLAVFGGTGADNGGGNWAMIASKTTATVSPIAAADWSYRFEAERGW